LQLQLALKARPLSLRREHCRLFAWADSASIGHARAKGHQLPAHGRGAVWLLRLLSGIHQAP
jgi:hypothetical protein